MAYRLLNCCDQPLRVDLRGGDTLTLTPGALSPVLREELLYENLFVERWLAQGLLQRLAASLSQAESRGGAGPEQAAGPDEEPAELPEQDTAVDETPAPLADNDDEDNP